MTPHKKKKNINDYVKNAITGIGIMAMALFLVGEIIVSIIN